MLVVLPFAHRNNRRVFQRALLQQKHAVRWNTQSNTTASSSFTDPVLVWASTNREVAQTCLQRPPEGNVVVQPPTCSQPQPQPPSSSITMSSFEDYWNWRRWDFSTAESGDETFYAQNLTTSVLSDPANIGFLLLPAISISGLSTTRATTGVQRGTIYDDYNSSSSFSDNNKERRSLHLCCLGARSEASLPTEYWKEILLMANETLGWTHVDLTMDFIGPEVVARPRPVRHSCSLTQGTVTLRWLYRGKFHEFLNKLPEKDLQQYSSDGDDTINTTTGINRTFLCWDAFVLFNPGIGHQNLQDDWKPTLDFLLSTETRRRPLLLTAHSRLDAQRDGMVLTQYLLDKAPLYQKNPWACRITHEDPFDASHMVRSNYCYHVIPY
ncbi:hypothetical protein ACA910_008594 [Epithemia clementina (nom. ined.)]